MSFLDTIRRAKAYLEEQDRVSLKALRLEFGLDADQLEALIEELVDIQQVAAREGKAVAWIGSAAGARVADPPTAPPTARAEAERRQLTVMFCDLVGSTRLAAGLDPEDWRDVVRSYQRACAAEIERFEGHIAQYLGDGLLVYFGHPRAHEDDAERAVRAGLAMLDSVGELNTRLGADHGLQIAVRIGVHTGPVVIGEVGGGERRETLALGDTANIAARLEGIAEPGTVSISAATLRLVSGLFVTHDCGPKTLKGVPQPVAVYRVEAASGVRGRLDTATGGLTPAVGRERELALVLDRWQEANASRGQAVLIEGEAGIGKSRLVQLVRERLEGTPHRWVECRCSPYTQRTAFHPLVELLERELGLEAARSDEEKWSRLEAAFGGAGSASEEVVPFLASVLSVPLETPPAASSRSGDLRREKAIEALVAWVIDQSRRQPLLLFVEDLHWCDPSTLEIIGRVLEQSTMDRVLSLLTLRPDFEPPWSLGSHCLSLPLRRLNGEETRQMVETIGAARGIARETIDRIVARADGVPLFVEELTQMLLESESAVEAIPATLQDSLMARLDRMTTAKDVAQLGAALGREFSYALLAAVSPDDETSLRQGLARLVEAELLHCRGQPPDATYTFKHALVQDAAYQSLLKRTRQQLHDRIVESLERDGTEAAAEPETLARHYEAAGRYEKAIHCLRSAAEQAEERSAHAEAISLLSHGIGLTREIPDLVERERMELALQLPLGASAIAYRGHASQEAAAAYGRARELAERRGDDDQLFRAIWGLRSATFIGGELATSFGLCEELLEVAERTRQDQHLILAHLPMGAQLFWQGNVTAALAHLRRSLELYQPARDRELGNRFGQEPGMSARLYEALTLWQLGYPDQAWAAAEKGVALARHGRPFDLANALCWAGVIRFLRREYQAVTPLATEGVDLAEDQGFPEYVGLGRALLGRSLVAAGRIEEAMEQMKRGMSALSGAGTGLGGPMLMASLAEVQWLSGRTEDAEGALRTGFHLAEQTGQRLWDPELHRFTGELALEAGQVEDAERSFAHAKRLAREGAARSLELRAATSLAKLLDRRGRSDEARSVLEPVHRWFTEGFATPDWIEAEGLLQRLGTR